MKFEVYKEFDANSYTFSNLILHGERAIDAKFFKSGELTNGKFSGNNKFC